MRHVTTILWRVGPVAAYIALLYSLSLDPGTPRPGTPGVDKVLHVAAYAVLGALLARAAGGTPRLAVALALTILGLGIGAGDETIQSAVPGREASLADVLADVIGVASGVTLSARLWRHRLVERWV